MTAAAPSDPPGLRRCLVACLCVALAALAGMGAAGGVAAADDGPAIENVTVDDDDSFAGVTEAHEVTVETSNTSGTNAAVSVDFEPWAGNVTEITVDTGTAVEGPTDGVVTVEPSGGFVEIDVVLEHPTTSGDRAIEARLRDGAGADLDDASAAIAVEPIDLTADIDGEVDAVGPNDAQTAELEIGLDGEYADAHGEELALTSPDLSADELFSILGEDDRVTRADGEIRVEAGSYDASFRDFDAATYRFEVSPVASDVFVRAETEVVEPEIDASFGTDRHEVPAGDSVTVEIDLEGLEGAYLLVGADHTDREAVPRNFLDVVYVEADSLTVNTRLLGTDAPSDAVYRTEGADPRLVSYLHDGPDEFGTGPEQRLAEVRFESADGRSSWDDLTAFREDLGMTPQPRPLQPERYRFVLGADGTVEEREDGIADFRHPIARSNLQVTEPGVESVRTFVAPRGPANEVGEPSDGDLEEHFEGLAELLTERGTVAKEDRLVVEINATGVYGALHYLDGGTEQEFESGVHPESAQALLDAHEGVILEAIQEGGTANEVATELDLGGATDGRAYLVPEPVTDEDPRRERFYLVVDTRDAGAFDGGFRDGEATDFALEYGYESPPDERYRFGAASLADRPGPFDPASEPTDDGTEHYPYLGTDATGESVTTPFSIEESIAEYDRTTGRGEVVVTNGTNATLSGETNVAPASEFYIQLVADARSNPTRITIDDVNVTEDGRFEASRDLTPLRVGEGLEVEFYAEDRLVDKRGGVVVDDPTAPSTFEVLDVPERVTVGQGEAATIAATVANTGPAAETKPIGLRIGGVEVDSLRRAIDGGDDREIGFEAGALDPGTYGYTVFTPDDEASGELVVEGEREGGEDAGPDGGEEADSDDTADGDDNETGPSEDDGESEDDSGEDDEGPDGPIGGLAPPLGAVGTEHAVGGAAVVGAAHVLGHFA